MKITIILCTIVIAVTSLVLAQSIVNIQPVVAASHWCEQKGKSQSWVEGCQQGWFDHDQCGKYTPEEPGAYVSGYKAGWNHGSCK